MFVLRVPRLRRARQEACVRPFQENQAQSLCQPVKCVSMVLWLQLVCLHGRIAAIFRRFVQINAEKAGEVETRAVEHSKHGNRTRAEHSVAGGTVPAATDNREQTVQNGRDRNSE